MLSAGTGSDAVRPRAVTTWYQLNHVFRRTAVGYWRNVQYNFIRFAVLAVLSFVFGVIFFKVRSASTIAVCFVACELFDSPCRLALHVSGCCI
jgi:hypothetical protein